MTAAEATDSSLTPFLRRVCSRVGLKLTLVLTAIIIFVELVVLVPSYFGLQRDLVAQTRSEALAVLSATLQVEMAMHEGAVSEIGAFLSEHGFIRGGVLYDVNGDVRGRFGEPPDLTLMEVAGDGTFSRAGETGQTRDFFIPYQETGLIFHAILRVDAGWIEDRLNRFLLNVGLIVLFLALACICGIAIALDLIVLSRLLGLRDAVAHAEERPDISDSFVVGDQVSDEVGDLSRTVDSLLCRVSQTYQEDLAAAVEINRTAPQAVLIYGPNHNLLSANDAALDLYGVPSCDALVPRAGTLLVSDRGTDTDIMHMAEQGSVLCEASARGAEGRSVPCFALAQAVDRPDGSILRYVLYLSDRRPELERLQGCETRVKSAEAQTASALGRVSKLHDALEACIAIITVETSPPPESPVRILPDRAVGTWVDEAETTGRFARDDVQHGALPPVMMPPDCADDLFRNILSLGLISIGEKGLIIIETQHDEDGMIRFVFTARATNPGESQAHLANEIAIIEGAIYRLAGRAGVSLEIPGFVEGTDEWRLEFTVPGAQDD